MKLNKKSILNAIHLWGARQNNLKNLRVKIPLNSLTVICGPSGSGKSSLAFETLYAEGQRRYIESLSNYSKQFVKKLPPPPLEGIENIPPTIFIGQKNKVKSSRSTVGTSTEILDDLKQFYEKRGEVFCPHHKMPLKKYTPFEGSQKILKNLDQKRIYILSPIDDKKRKYKGKTLIKNLLKEGFLRIFIKEKKKKSTNGSENRGESGEIKYIRDFKDKIFPRKKVYLIIDRLQVGEKECDRIEDSLSQAYLASLRYNEQLTSEACIMTVEGEKLFLSETPSCPFCAYQFPSFDSRLFSFNNPVGACSNCKGFGNTLEIDPKKVIPNPNLSLAEGACKPLTFPSTRNRFRALMKLCKEKKINTHEFWKNLKERDKKIIWDKILAFFSHLERKKYKMHIRVFLSRFRSPILCSLCKGKRFKKEAYQVYFKGKSIDEFITMTIENLFQSFSSFKLTKNEKKNDETLYFQILLRLKFLIKMGLGYLTLDRPTKTLSGGEFQRLNLSHHLGKNLSQILYILDEPTIGLHPRDTEKLLNMLELLRKRKNTLLVVEHDQDVIQKASYIIEMGPRSGTLGGQIIFSGDKNKFLKSSKSNTACYLQKTPSKSKHQKKPKLQNTKHNSHSSSLQHQRPMNMKKHVYKIDLTECKGHNLKNINLSLPLRRFVSVTGVSGSGKSSLISHTLYPALLRTLKKDTLLPCLEYKKIKGIEFIKDVHLIDQSPVGKTLRSHSLSYLKVNSHLRDLMASTNEAKALNLTPGHFSLNLSKGRCSACEGLGFKTLPMIFMDDIQVICEKCHGKKFSPQILEVKLKGKNINDILKLTVKEALDFFIPFPQIRKPLLFLKEVGLDYIQLGQNTQSLSGGENQRLKIAKSLSQNVKKDRLYIMDEPTKGLHFREVHLLLKVLHHLVDSGNSLLVIEHNLEVLKHSDYIIDLGPEAEALGGKIIALGSPKELIRLSKKSHTAFHLKKYMNTSHLKNGKD